MKTVAFLTVLIMFSTLGAFYAFSEEEEDPEGKMPASLTDHDKKDLARTAFLIQGKDNKEWLYIRLTVRQYNAVKDRADGNSIVRIVLTPRQHLAIKNALQLDNIASKLIIRAKAEQFTSSRGSKGRYIIRPASYFRTFASVKNTAEETDTAENPPDTIFDLITED